MSFPFFVLSVFTYLVINHNVKLYAPNEFHSEEAWLATLRAKVEQVEAVGRRQEATAQDTVKKITMVLKQEGMSIEQSSKVVQTLQEQLSTDIIQSNNIEVDAREFLNDPMAIYSFPILAFASLSDLTDTVYYKLKKILGPSEYGYSWVLRDVNSKEIIVHARMITKTQPGKRIKDYRTLEQVGIKAGAKLVVLKP